MLKNTSPDYSRLAYLILHYHGKMNKRLRKELETWLRLSDRNRILLERFSSEEYLRDKMHLLHELDRKRAWNKLAIIINTDQELHAHSSVEKKREVLSIRRFLGTAIGWMFFLMKGLVIGRANIRSLKS